MLSMNGKRMKRLAAMLLTICMLSASFADLPSGAFRGRAEDTDIAPMAGTGADGVEVPTAVGNDPSAEENPAPEETQGDGDTAPDGETASVAGEQADGADTPDGETTQKADDQADGNAVSDSETVQETDDQTDGADTSNGETTQEADDQADETDTPDAPDGEITSGVDDQADSADAPKAETTSEEYGDSESKDLTDKEKTEVSNEIAEETPSIQSESEITVQNESQPSEQNETEAPVQNEPEPMTQDDTETAVQSEPESATQSQSESESLTQIAPETQKQIAPETQIQTEVDNLTGAIEATVKSDVALSTAQIAYDTPTPSQADAPTQDASKEDNAQPGEEEAEQDDAAETSISPQAVQLAETLAALADPGTTTDTVSSGNSAKDMAASVEFQDPFNPSDNPVPVKTLQDQIKEKLAGMDTLKGTVKIDLGRNTNYAGDIALKRVDLGKVENDFVLELASEDAGEDGLSANGSTVLDGNVAIEGLNVVMKGVRMALNRVITVVAGVAKVGDAKKENGTLKYYGTTADDIVTMEAGSGGSASIYTGEGNDRVGLLTTNATKKTEVNTGAGDDTVYAYINGGESLVDTEEGDDRVELYSYGSQPQAKEGEAAKPQVVVQTGAGNDSVQVALSGSAMVDVDTGVNKASVEDDDDVTIFGRYGGGNVNVTTESGSDYVRIAKNFQAPDLVRIVPDVTGIDQLEVTATGEGVIPNPVSVMDVNMGTGNNRVDIDMSVGDTYASVDLSGDTAHRVHLTGALKPKPENEDEDKAPRISGDANNLKLLTENGNILSIKTKKDVTHHFTDALSGKHRMELQEGAANIVPEPFTDYVLKFDPKGKVVAPFKKDSSGLLTNLVVDADAIPGWRSTLGVQTSGLLNTTVELGDIDASGVNLLVKGANIVFTGKVLAENVMAYA